MTRNFNPLSYTGTILSNPLRFGDKTTDIAGKATLTLGTVTVSFPITTLEPLFLVSKFEQIGTGGGTITIDSVTLNAVTRKYDVKITSLSTAGAAVTTDLSQVNYKMIDLGE